MSGADFVKVIDFEEEIEERLGRMGSRASLMEEVDQKNQEAKLMKSKVTNLSLEFAKTSRIIGFWIKGKKVEGKEILDNKNAKRLFGVIEELEYSLNYSRAAAKYSLEQREEEIVRNNFV